MKTIYPFFKWLDGTWVNRLINDSTWIFAAIEAVHIVALALLFGSVIILNLRLLGVTMRGRSLPRLNRELEPFALCSLVVILISGGLLFAAEAVKSFHSTPFRIKMVLLLLAIVFHYGVSWRLMQRDEADRSAVISKAAAVFAIALWISVGFAGRAIGFF